MFSQSNYEWFIGSVFTPYKHLLTKNGGTDLLKRGELDRDGSQSG
ncbi:MAG TPA: hypothetical protein VIU13_09530 [Chryseolinea sp.]